MKKIFVAGAIVLSSFTLFAQNEKTANEGENVFTTVKDIRITPVENQANSGTCWAYSGIGFWESELLRAGKGTHRLSEMFVVSHNYRDKGKKYVRLHGKLNFGQGGSFYDDLYVFKNYGCVPYEVMKGLDYGTDKNQHSELAEGLQAYLNAIIKNPNGKLSTAWEKAYNGIIDSYLGKIPTEFTYNGKKYTPMSYAKSLGLNPDDYVSITSYTHHPFWTSFPLEIEDNWRWASSYNVPLDDMMRIMENAIENGYPIAWGADVSEIGFTRDGIGVLADVPAIETAGSDQARWVGLNPYEKQMKVRELIKKADCPEITPSQELRQQGFDNYQTTDDHGMVIFGIAKNQNGRKFFMIKNSWGLTGKYNGIWYISYNFAAMKTMNFVVNKHALPKDIANKLGIKL